MTKMKTVHCSVHSYAQFSTFAAVSREHVHTHGETGTTASSSEG